MWKYNQVETKVNGIVHRVVKFTLTTFSNYFRHVTAQESTKRIYLSGE